MKEIDEHYTTAKTCIRLGDKEKYNLVWEIWGGENNRKILPWIKGMDAENDICKGLKFVYAYWWNRMRLLYLFSKSRVGKIAEKNKMEEKAKILRSLIKREPVKTPVNADDILLAVTKFLADMEKDKRERANAKIKEIGETEKKSNSKI